MDEWKYIAMFMFLKYLSRAVSRNCLQTHASSIIGHTYQEVLGLNLNPDIVSYFLHFLQAHSGYSTLK